MAESDLKTCPKCNQSASELIDLDAGARAMLEKAGMGSVNQICSTCYSSISGQVSQGAKLLLEKQARDKNRHMVWKGRVNLVKRAKQLMLQKAYSEAAVNYEKYIRVLEISYDLKPGQLNPGVFGNSLRSKEMTVIATTYWDLLRIYDTNQQYRQRMAVAAVKLAEFLPFTPMFDDIIKQAQSYLSSSKNPDIVKDFLRRSKALTKRCFIATAAYSSDDHPIVCDLRLFRDSYLLRFNLGRIFVEAYYKTSPPLAHIISQNPLLKRFSRIIIRGIHFWLPKKYKAQNSPGGTWDQSPNSSNITTDTLTPLR